MRELSPAEIRAFLTSGTRTGKLAVVRADGRPHVTPIWFDLDDAGPPVFTTRPRPVPAGARPEEALANTIDLARAAERLGYRRYWPAEPPHTRRLAGPAPEVMVPTVAAPTRAVRVASAGVLLPPAPPRRVPQA